jgi:hypothetical protein
MIHFPVAEKTKFLLDIGNEAIEFARKQLPYGPGNLLDEIRRSEYESYRRFCYHNILLLLTDSEKFDQHKKIRSRAHLASHTQGGDCISYACLTFVYLRSRFFADHRVKIILCSSETLFGYHYFVALGTSDNLLPDSVIVDAWLPGSMALLWQHHKSFGLSDIKIHATKLCDGRLYEKKSKFLLKNFSQVYKRNEIIVAKGSIVDAKLDCGLMTLRGAKYGKDGKVTPESCEKIISSEKFDSLENLKSVALGDKQYIYSCSGTGQYGKFAAQGVMPENCCREMRYQYEQFLKKS